jgi:uncharacterized surface protein with fasciclin (FAS1) repeats
MTVHRLLSTAAAAVLATAACGAAWAQTTQTQTTQTQTTQAAPAQSAPAPAATAQPPAAAPAAAFTPVVPRGDIVSTLQASGEFKTFVKALDATNLTSVLKTHSNLTVFAPTDAAFAAYDPSGKLFSDLPGLQKLLTHHLINAVVDSTKFKNAHGPVTSVAGDQIVLDGTTPTLKADNANILQADIHASNGLIDVVDQVLKAGSVPATLPDQQQTPEAAPSGEAAPTSASAPEDKASSSAAKGTKHGH